MDHHCHSVASCCLGLLSLAHGCQDVTVCSIYREGSIGIATHCLQDIHKGVIKIKNGENGCTLIATECLQVLRKLMDFLDITFKFR